MSLTKKRLAIVIITTCTLFTAAGQLMMKIGMRDFSISTILLNAPLLIGIFCYAVGAVLMLFAMKKADLSMVYPFIALSFIWVALLSKIFLGEIIVAGEWIGIATVIAGVSFIGRGANG